MVALYKDDPDFSNGSALLLNSMQWDVIRDLADALEVIEKATTHLSREKYEPCHRFFLWLVALQAQLAENDRDQTAFAAFKHALCSELTDRFSLDVLSPTCVMVLCAAFHPHFWSL